MERLLQILNQRLPIGCGLLTVAVCAGTFGFVVIEGWAIVDAFFTTVLVVSTLGFTDLRPITPAGKLLTVILIGGGVGALYYLTAAIVQSLIESQLDRGKRRMMETQITRLQQHFIVCGYGRVGQETCRQLKQQGQLFVVIENDAQRLVAIRQAGYRYVEGDASDDAVLRQAGIDRARALLTAVQSDAANVYITLSARDLNPNLFIVARAAEPEAAHKLTIAGANRVISPYVLGGRSMAGMALRPAVMDFLDVLMHSDDLGMWLEEIRITSDSPFAETAIGDARLREQAGVTILAVRRNHGGMIVNPSVNVTLHAGDTLIVLGTQLGVEQIREPRAGE